MMEMTSIRNLHCGQVDDFGAELGGLGLGDVGLLDDFIGQQKIDHAHAGGAGFCAGVGDLVGGHSSEIDQNVCQIIVFLCHKLNRSHQCLQERPNRLPPKCVMSTRGLSLAKKIFHAGSLLRGLRLVSRDFKQPGFQTRRPRQFLLQNGVAVKRT